MPEYSPSSGAPDNKSRIVHRNGNRLFWDLEVFGSKDFSHVLRATKIYPHTVNIDVYVSVDTGSFSVAILLTYYAGN